jgi:hypothetical protein
VNDRLLELQRDVERNAAIVRTHRIAAVAFSIVPVLAAISMASMLTAALLALLVGGCVGTTLLAPGIDLPLWRTAYRGPHQ